MSKKVVFNRLERPLSYFERGRTDDVRDIVSVLVCFLNQEEIRTLFSKDFHGFVNTKKLRFKGMILLL